MRATSYVQNIAPDPVNREKDDFYPTPPRATRSLLSVEKFDGEVWEPACGDGAVSTILHEAGYSVLSSDLVDRGYGFSPRDFLLESYRTDNVITNPPFKLAEQFARHALSLTSRKVALLCRLAWLEGKARRVMFASTPLARVWVFSSRITMVRGGDMSLVGGGSMTAFAWFVWEHGHEGPPALGWLP